MHVGVCAWECVCMWVCVHGSDRGHVMERFNWCHRFGLIPRLAHTVYGNWECTET